MAGMGTQDHPSHCVKIELMADAQEQLDLAWKAFKSVPFSDAAYSTYLNKLLGIASHYPEIDHIVARYIAHTMFLEGIDGDAAKEAVAQYAGVLENPALSGEPRAEIWREMTKLVRELTT